MSFEGGKAVGPWTLVSEVDAELTVPLWIGDDGKHVAYIRHHRVRSIEVVRRLGKVVEWAKAFEHNNLLPMRGLEEVLGGVAVISQYEEGQPLASMLARARLTRRPMPAPVAVALTLDVLDGLHALGGRLTPAWAHGGLRPEAILVTRAGRARLMEVGITATLATVDPLANETSWLAYGAPEQLGTGRVEAAADVFSAANILWEMLVGRRLFDGRDRAAIVKATKGETSQRPDQARKEVPKAVSMVVAQALEHDPEDRYDQVGDFTSALRAAAGDGVAEPYEVSQYLESLQLVTLDKRRRVLESAMGRAAPPSLPPPPTKKKTSVAPLVGAPKVPIIEPPKTAPSTLPSVAAEAAPSPEADEPEGAGAAARTATTAKASTGKAKEAKPSVSVAPRPTATAPRLGSVRAEAAGSSPPGEPSSTTPHGDEVSPAPSSDPPSSDPPSSDPGESAAAAPTSEPPREPDEEGEGTPEPVPSQSVDVRFSDAGGSEPPSGEPAPEAAEAPKLEPAPEPAPAAATAPLPDGDLLLDDQDLAMPAPRRWPLFAAGFVAGALVTFVGVQIGLLPGPSPAAATSASQSAPPPPPPPVLPELKPPPDPEPEPEPSATAAEDPEPAPRRRRRVVRPRPRPASPPPPAAPPPPPPPPPPAEGDIYD